MNTKLAEHNSLEKYFSRRKTFPLLLLASFLIRQSSQARNTIYFPSRLGGGGAGGAGGILMLLWTKKKMKGNIEAFFLSSFFLFRSFDVGCVVYFQSFNEELFGFLLNIKLYLNTPRTKLH